MRNERIIFYGSILAVLLVVALISVWIPTVNQNGNGEFEYLSYPQGAYHYAGSIVIGEHVNVPAKLKLPKLSFVNKYFDMSDVNQMIEDFEIKHPNIREYPEYYDVYGDDGKSLAVYKNGYKILYTAEKVELKNVELSKEQLIEFANEYLSKYEKYLPKGVDIKLHDVLDDRMDVTVDENGTIEEIYYTKDVIYDCYYEETFVGLILKIELDHQGNMVGFETMPVEVKKSGEIEVKAFEDVHKWMESGLPVPVSPRLIKSVEIRDVKLAVLPQPASSGGVFQPAYIVSIHITGIESAANCDYIIDIGGIER